MNNKLPEWVDVKQFPFRLKAWNLPMGVVRGVDDGSGSPVVFVHGTPTWSFEFRHLIARLCKSHRCLAPDHLGFGLSDFPGEFTYSPEDHAGVFACWADRVVTSSTIFVLHDFGGPIALDWMLRNSDRVKAVVVLNSFGWRLDDDPKMAQAARLAGSPIGKLLYRYANASLRILMPSMYGNGKLLTQAIHKHYLEVFKDRERRVRVLFALAKSLTTSGRYFDSIWNRRAALSKVPAVIVWGDRDRAFPKSFADKWREFFQNSTIRRIENAGHWPHEETPNEVIHEIETFISKLPEDTNKSNFGP